MGSCLSKERPKSSQQNSVHGNAAPSSPNDVHLMPLDGGRSGPVPAPPSSRMVSDVY